MFLSVYLGMKYYRRHKWRNKVNGPASESICECNRNDATRKNFMSLLFMTFGVEMCSENGIKGDDKGI